MGHGILLILPSPPEPVSLAADAVEVGGTETLLQLIVGLCVTDIGMLVPVEIFPESIFQLPGDMRQFGCVEFVAIGIPEGAHLGVSLLRS